MNELRMNQPRKLLISCNGEPINPQKMRVRLSEKGKVKYSHWKYEKPKIEDKR